MKIIIGLLITVFTLPAFAGMPDGLWELSSVVCMYSSDKVTQEEIDKYRKLQQSLFDKSYSYQVRIVDSSLIEGIHLYKSKDGKVCKGTDYDIATIYQEEKFLVSGKIKWEGDYCQSTEMKPIVEEKSFSEFNRYRKVGTILVIRSFGKEIKNEGMKCQSAYKRINDDVAKATTTKSSSGKRDASIKIYVERKITRNLKNDVRSI